MRLVGALALGLAVAAAILATHGVEGHPTGARHPDAHALDDAGWRLPLGLWEAARACIAGMVALVAVAFGLEPLVFGAAAAIVPSLAVRERARAARREARAATARIVAAIHAAVRSGVALPEAMRRGLEVAPVPLARRPWETALRDFTLGAPLDAALAAAASGESDERVRATLDTFALGVGERLSLERVGSLAGSLAERLAYAESLDDEVRARTGGARMQVHLLAAVVPCLALYLAATTPGVGAVLAGDLGRSVLVPLAVALELVGILLSRRALDAVSR